MVVVPAEPDQHVLLDAGRETNDNRTSAQHQLETPPRDTEQFYFDGSRPKPSCRGKIHMWCFFLLPVWGAPLIVVAGGKSALAVLVALLFLSGAAASLGASAHYHRRQHRGKRQERLALQADFLGIYMLIAGTFSPVCGPSTHHAADATSVLSIAGS